MKPTTALALGALVLSSMVGQARAQYGYPSPGMPGINPAGIPITPTGVPLPPPYAPPGMAVYGPLETLQGSPLFNQPMQPLVPAAGMQSTIASKGPVQGLTVSQNKGEALPAPMAAPAAPMMQATPEDNAFTQSPCWGTDNCCGKHRKCKDTCCDDDESHFGLVLFMGLDAWGGIADNVLQTIPTGQFAGQYVRPGQGNFGFREGLNLGVGLIESWGIGFQAGGNWGHYDLDGRPNPDTPNIGSNFPVDVTNSQWQSQAFFTTGLFKRADIGPAFSMALVLDYMMNSNYGPFAMEPSLRQWRLLFGLPWNEKNEIGFWGALRDGSSTQGGLLVGNGQFSSITWEAVSQYNLYWRHQFAAGAEGTIYFGLLDNSRHGLANGSLGSWVLGGSLEVPITDHLSIYASAAYMRPSSRQESSPGESFGSFPSSASTEDAYNISVGLAWYPCTCLRSCKRGWLPALPVANNGTFLVDTSGFALPQLGQ